MGWGERRAWESGAGMLILKQKDTWTHEKEKGERKEGSTRRKVAWLQSGGNATQTCARRSPTASRCPGPSPPFLKTEWVNWACAELRGCAKMYLWGWDWGKLEVPVREGFWEREDTCNVTLSTTAPLARCGPAVHMWNLGRCTGPHAQEDPHLV